MKKLFALMMAAAMALSLAACAAPAAEAPAEAPAAEAPAAEAPAAEEPAAEEPAAEYGPVLSKIKESGKIVVGTEAQYPPYEFKDMNANFVGCDMWLADQIAAELGVEVEIVDMAFDGIIPAVQSGQVDIGIAAFTYTDEREEVIDFTELYEVSPQMILVKAGNEATYSTLESFAGQKVGSQRGTVQSQLITKVMTESELFELDKNPELALEVLNGNIAALVLDSAVGQAMMEANPGLAVAQYTFPEDVMQFGKACLIAEENTDLLEILNGVITTVVEDGSYQAAYDEAVELAKTLGL